jgi:hypothetical protein
MKMRAMRVILAGIVAALALAALPSLERMLAESKPAVHLNTSKAAPRQLEDTTEQAIARDYGAAWQAMERALESNTTAPLNENFTGFALEKFTQRVKDQKQNGLSTRIIDHGHKVDAVFYSPDGSAMQLKDTATLETQVLDGGKVIHSEQGQVHYWAIMTGAEDRWKVRVLQSDTRD